MKKKIFLMVILVFTFAQIYGCANGGMFLALNNTSVQLSEPNYEIIAKGISGTSKAGYLLGISYSLGASTNTVALARVEGTGQLYQEAVKDLWNNFEQNYGSIEGRKVALANVHYDSESMNFIFYTEVQVFIRADVIEFLE
jgi:hypothetical protein